MALINAAAFMRLEVTHCRIELRQGIVHERPFLDAASGYTVNRLMVEAYTPYLEDAAVVGLAGGTGFQTERDPDTVIAPNGAFFCHNRLRNVDENVYLTLVPDIVIEARLPDMQEEESATRAGWWLHFGARTVWIVDAGRQTLTVSAAGKAATTFHIEDIFDGGAALPGFMLPIKRLFRDTE